MKWSNGLLEMRELKPSIRIVCDIDLHHAIDLMCHLRRSNLHENTRNFVFTEQALDPARRGWGVIGSGGDSRAGVDDACHTFLSDIKWSRLESFSLEIPSSENGFKSTHDGALNVGKNLLEEESIAAVYLLARKPITQSARREKIECLFGPLHVPADGEMSNRCNTVSTVRKFDFVEVQPWTLYGKPFFSDGGDMKQAFRITRREDTQLGSFKCAAQACGIHTSTDSLDELQPSQ